jgi:hypothetical protein
MRGVRHEKNAGADTPVPVANKALVGHATLGTGTGRDASCCLPERALTDGEFLAMPREKIIGDLARGFSLHRNRSSEHGVVGEPHWRRGGLMAKRKLLEEIKLNPQRYYRAPSDVNRDRRFSDEERLQILAAWEHGMRSTTDESENANFRLRQVADARAEVEKRVPVRDAMRADSKAHGARE